MLIGILEERTARDTCNGSSDDIIKQYTEAFRQLKEDFKTRTDSAMLKVLRDVRQGVVRLTDTLGNIEKLGKDTGRLFVQAVVAQYCLQRRREY
jgi:hypothetical protein